MAEKVLDNLEILGVGCPKPNITLPVKPPQPCWRTNTCPPKNIFECDEIREKIKLKKVSSEITDPVSKCFMAHLKPTNEMESLKYSCVNSGMAEDNGYYLGEADWTNKDTFTRGPDDESQQVGQGYMSEVKKNMDKLYQLGVAGVDSVPFSSNPMGLVDKGKYFSYNF